MTKKPSRVRILMMPYLDDENSEPVGYSGPATVLTGLPRTIRRHGLRLIVPLADSTIYEMEKRGDFPHRFNLTPRCVVWDLEEVEAWLEHAAKPIWQDGPRSLPAQMYASGRRGPQRLRPTDPGGVRSSHQSGTTA